MYPDYGDMSALKVVLLVFGTVVVVGGLFLLLALVWQVPIESILYILMGSILGFMIVYSLITRIRKNRR